MVAIVTGNGLGLERSSANILGSRGQLGSAGLGRGNDNVTVNAATGNLIIQNTDEVLIGRGPDSVINRTYNSLGAYTNLAGGADTDNWLNNTQRKIVLTGTGNQTGSTATLTDWDGTVIVFNWVSATVGYKATENPYRDDTLTWAGNVFTWTEGKSRTVQTFASNVGGRLLNAADADGNTILYTYDAATTAGKLTRVTTANSSGTQFNYTDLTYTGANLMTLVTSYLDTVSATNKTLTRTRYAYDTSNRLKRVSVDLSPGDNSIATGTNYWMNYAYVGTSKQVSTITQSDGTSLAVTYVTTAGATLGRVATLTLTAASGDTRLTSFAYDTVNRITTITDPLLNISKMTYDTTGRLTRVEEPVPVAGGLPSITDYTYNTNGDVMTAFVTEGISGTAIARDFYQYDTNGNVTQLYRWTETDYRVTRWTYGAKNELLTETVFANVDADGDGGVAPTGAETTRYAYDAENHLRFVVSPEGRVNEYRYDAPGNLIATISYSGTLYATGSLAANVSIAESTLATWVSGTADKAQSQRTDSVYDFRGNITTATSWSTTDAAGNGVTTANWSRMTYVYDQFGKLLSRLVSGTNDLGGEPTYTAETFVYDGLGRAISTVDVFGVASTIAYNDTARTTTVTTPNDTTKASTFNIAGELINFVGSGTGIAAGTTLYAYDKLGRLRVKTDPVLVKTYYLYDKQSRLTAEVDGDGSMTEFKYDSADRMIASVRYATALTAAQLTTLGTVTTNTEVATVRPTAAATDRWSWNIYDKSGKLIQTIDATGAAAKLDYDGAGRLVKTTGYNALLAAATVTGFKTTLPTALTLPTADATYDRVVRSFYGVDGLLYGTLDEEGFLTRYKYDFAGRLTTTVRFANVASSSLWAAGTLADLLANIAPQATDISTRQVYDGRNRVIATIDGEGNVTRYHYTARGDVDQEIRGQQVAANTPYTMATLPAPTGTLETTRFFRNAAGLVTSQVKTLTGGTETTTFTYDNRGRLLSQTTSETVSTETRTQRFRYDVKGRLIGSLDGVGSATLVANPTDAQISTAINTYGTRYNYDPADRLISRIDPDGTGAAGRTTRFYYDTDGQLRYEINALGEVMEYRYNALEDRTDTFVYATRIAPATLTTLTGGLVVAAVNNAITAIANSALDSRSQYTYTNRGELLYDLRPGGGLNDYEAYYYNAFGEENDRYSYPQGADQTNRIVTAYYRRGLTYFDQRLLNGSSNPTDHNINVYGYDAFGRRTIEYTNNSDWQHQTTYGYDHANRLTIEGNSYGQSRSLSYDARSNLISQTDRTGKVTTFAYDLFNRNVTTTTSEGVVSSVKKNAYGQTIQITDGAGRTTSYTYDKNGNLKTVTDAAGTTTNNYDNADRLIETIDAKGVSIRYTYDAANRVLTRVEDFGTGKLNLTTTTTYDAKGQSISMTDALGVITTYTYDLKGQKTRIVQDSGDGKLNITTDFVYRADGKVTSQIDAVGTTQQRTTNFEYDSMGRLTRKVEDAGGLNVQTLYVWDENSNLVATTDTLGRVTRFVYDLENRLQFTVNAEGEVTENVYDAEGRVIWTRAYANKIAAGTLAGFANKITAAQVNGNAATSASDRINRTMYDGDGRAVYSVDGEGFVTRNVYDGANNVIKTIRYADAVGTGNSTLKADMDAALGSSASPPATASVTTYAYDAANRLTDITSAFGTAEATTTHFIMDAIGQITHTVVGWGTADESTTMRGFDNAGRMGWETRAAFTAEASTTSYFYDALGRVTSMATPSGHTTTRIYDNLGRMLSETVPLDISPATTATTSYQYDARGNRVKITDPRGNVGYFFYDGTDRLVQQVDPEGYVTETSYAIGTNVSSVKRYYNRANNLASVSVTVKATVTAHSQDATTSFTYDKADKVLTATDAMGFVETYWYDGLGNRTQMQNKLGGITGYTYDKNGRLRYEYVTQNTYNSSGTLTASAFYKNIYEYDARGNMVHHVQAYGLAERLDTYYAYDKLDRLITKTDPAILGQTPVTTYQYDKRGNVILMTAPDGGKTYSFYDDNNRKVAEISPVNTHTTWTYDANGNVTSQKIYSAITPFPATAGGTPPAPSGTFRETLFIYDRNNRLTETRIPGVRVGSFNGSNYATTAGQTLTSINQYDAAGNLIREQDSNGSSIYHYYDKNGREIAKIDQENYLTMFDRDSEGNVTRDRRVANKIPVAVSTTSDPVALFNTYNGGISDRITDFSYDKNGRRTHEYRYYVDYATVGATGALTTGQTTAVITYYYNGLGEVTQKYESTGDYTYYGYDNQGRMTLKYSTGITDHNGTAAYDRTDYYYDGLNNLVRESQHEYYSTANERITQYTYDGGKLRTVTDATGFQRLFWYNAMGQQIVDYYTRVKSDGTNDTTYNGNFTGYDLAGRVAVQYQADYRLGNDWTRVGPATQITYNAFGEVAARSIDHVVQESLEYDNAGRVVKTSAGDGVWKFLVYDANGNNTLVLQSNGRNLSGDTVDSVLAYVGVIDTMSVTDVVATITTYDKRNMTLSTREPNRTIASAGNARVNTTQTLVRSRAYNAFGEVAAETDARGNTTSFTYNTMGRLTQKQSPFVDVTGENGVITSLRPTENYYYDLSGRMIATRDAVSNATGVAYYTTRTLLANTGYGGTEAKVLKEFRPDGSVWETQYDVFGDARVTIDGINSAKKAAGQAFVTTQSSYDKLGRVTQITHMPTAAGTLEEYFAYDGLGQRIKHWNSFLQTPIYGPPVIVDYDIKTGAPIYNTPIIGYTTIFETTDYDIQGRVSSTKSFGGDVTTTAYSWNSALTTTGMGTFGGWTAVTNYYAAEAPTVVVKTKTENKDSFGRLINQTNLGGQITNFTYDLAGRITNYTTGTGSWGFTWLNTGKRNQVTVNDGGITTTTFGYDADGNIVHEKLVRGSTTYKDLVATYDGLGRMASWAKNPDISTGALVTTFIEYDANGNVRAKRMNAAEEWFKYDTLNRITTDQGSFAETANLTAGRDPGSISTFWGRGKNYTYDANGNRAQSVRQARPVFGHVGETITYTYDNENRLIQTYMVGTEGSPRDGYGSYTATNTNVYDLLGRRVSSDEGLTPFSYGSSLTQSWNTKGQLVSSTSTTAGSPSSSSTTTYNYFNASGQYFLGQVASTSTAQGSSTQTQTNQFVWYDGAVRSSTTVTGTGAQASGVTTYSFDSFGLMIYANITGAQNWSSSYVYDAASQGIYRSVSGQYGGPLTTYRMGGVELYDPLGTTVETPSSASSGTYSVRSGDTLYSIALTLWGDRSLWYKLAEANGLNASSSLTEGQSLQIPGGVYRTRQAADTFIPYDAGKFVGNTEPSPLFPAPPKAKGCGILGTILLVAIAVAVTIVTKGAAAKFAASLLGVKATATAAVVVGGALAAAAGSVVSQAVGVATGLQDKFSFKGVALAAIGGAVGAGLGEIGGKLGSFLNADTFVSNVARGMISSAATQGIAVATGLQKKFDWVGVAAAGAAAGVGGAVARGMDVKNGVFDRTVSGYAQKLVSGMAGDIASSATRSLLNGSDFGDNLLAALPSTIGQTIGELAVNGITSRFGTFAKGIRAIDPKATKAEIRQLYSDFKHRRNAPVIELVNMPDNTATFDEKRGQNGTISLSAEQYAASQSGGKYAKGHGAVLLWGYLEELGHWADMRLHSMRNQPGGDARGDEGIRFAAAVLPGVLAGANITSFTLDYGIALTNGSSINISADTSSLKAVAVSRILSQLTPGAQFSENRINGVESFGPEGHYMTSFLEMLGSGMVIEGKNIDLDNAPARLVKAAKELALGAQLPDMLGKYDAASRFKAKYGAKALQTILRGVMPRLKISDFWSPSDDKHMNEVYVGLHAIPDSAQSASWISTERNNTGRYIVEQMQQGNFVEAGVAVHRFGDLFAHVTNSGKTFEGDVGHLFSGHTPDNLYKYTIITEHGNPNAGGFKPGKVVASQRQTVINYAKALSGILAEGYGLYRGASPATRTAAATAGYNYWYNNFYNKSNSESSFRDKAMTTIQKHGGLTYKQMGVGGGYSPTTRDTSALDDAVKEFK